MKVFLDTNVVIGFICKREPFFTDAKNIFVMHEKGEIECCVSALTIINCAYIMRKVFEKDSCWTIVQKVRCDCYKQVNHNGRSQKADLRL